MFFVPLFSASVCGEWTSRVRSNWKSCKHIVCAKWYTGHCWLENSVRYKHYTWLYIPHWQHTNYSLVHVQDYYCIQNPLFSTFCSNTSAMFSSELETDPQFVFTPPQLRHEVSFPLTMMTLGSYGYDADLSSYSNIQLQCSFSNEAALNTTIILRQGTVVTRSHD